MNNNFPFAPILAETELSVSGSARNKYASGGFTARDYFAAHAPLEIPAWFDVAAADGREVNPNELMHKRYFLWRWYYADMMLAVREND